MAFPSLTCPHQIVVAGILAVCILIVSMVIFSYRHKTTTTIQHIRDRVYEFLDRLGRKYPHHSGVQRLIRRSKHTVFLKSNSTRTFTANKGEYIKMCLSKGDHNTFMFVILHEMAHVMSLSTHHTPEFWSNFRFLLHEAARMHFYDPVDYNHTPVPYCAMILRDNPYFKSISEDDMVQQIKRAIFYSSYASKK